MALKFEKFILSLSKPEIEELIDIANARLLFIKSNNIAFENIKDMDVSTRLLKICKANDIINIDDLAGMTPSEFMNLRGAGVDTLFEAIELLSIHNKTFSYKQFKY